LNWAREVKDNVEQWKQQFTYDRWGNRTINTGVTYGVGVNNKAFAVAACNTSADPCSNRLLVPSGQSGVMTYDAAGNLTNDTYTGAGIRTYDAENKIISAWGGNNQAQLYAYDASGQRIKRTVDGVETWQVYGLGGELVAEYPSNGAVASPQKEYGYRNGQLLITASPGTGLPPSSGLAGYWKFDENSGTTTADSSGNNNTGTLTSGATWATGQSNAATSFDGVDDYVQMGAQSSLVMTSTATFSAWIYPTGAGSMPIYGGVILSKEGEYEVVRATDGTIQWAFANTSPGWNFINTGYVAPLNQWTHVAVTYDNGVIKTYVNGTLVNTYSGSGSIGDVLTSQNDFRVGGRQTTSQNFQGRIDEARVYNRALSATEVATLPTSAPSGLVGYWRFDENSGTTAADSSGHNNSGTLTSGATWATGQNNAATSFDGVDDYLQIGAQSSLVMTSTATFSAWIYPTGAGSMPIYGGVILSKEGEYEIVRATDGTIQWAFANTSPGWNFTSTGYVAPLNQWTHVAVTYDNGVIKTYINGTLVNTYSGSGSIGDVLTSQNDFRVGGRQTTSQNFQGRIDEARVYNRALSATEVATLPSGAGAGGVQIQWLITDHLGTPRMVLDQNGALASMKRHDYLPFGEELFAPTGGRTAAQGYTSGDAIRQQFTQKERDIETGLDFFGARYYLSTQGRFTSIDPENYQAMLDPSDPQSWNAYSYVNNSPLRRVDPDGRGFFTKLKNWLAWDVWGEDEDVKRVEEQKRAMLVRLQQENPNHELIVQSPITGQFVLLHPETMNRMNLWLWSNAVSSSRGSRDLTPEEAANVLDSTMNAGTLIYEKSPKHGATTRGNVSGAPQNGQSALDNSIQIKETSTRRIGIDRSTNEFVVFDNTNPGTGTFHGHVRSWGQLTQEMKNALIKAGEVTRTGKIIPK
jgi:RHS repeat-associated protein